MDGEMIETRISRIWMGRDGILRSHIYSDSEHTLQDAKEHTAAGVALAKGKRYRLLCDLTHGGSQTPEAREYYAGPESSRHVIACAFVVKSVFARVAGNFYLGLNRSESPTRLFNTEDQAVEWLNQFPTE